MNIDKANIMKEKLTYYHICSLCAQGLYHLIPSEYIIVWGGNKPEKVIDKFINGNCVKFIRNSFAQPDYIKICGEYKVIVPDMPYDDEVEDKDENTLEYGEVLIRTEFILSKLEFCYKQEHESDLAKYRSEFLDMFSLGRGYIRKQDTTFDCDITIEETCWHIKNMMLHEQRYPELSYELTEDNLISVNFTCDFWNRELLNY